MMSSVQDSPPDSYRSGMPRGPLLAIGVVLIVALLGVAAVRLSGMDIREPDAAPAVTRTLQFADRADGGVDVIDASTGHHIDVITGESGFIRGTLRGLARERHRTGIGSEPPFELIGRTDGRLTLVDPSTGQRVDLESFGPTNAAAFSRLLALPAN
jgi:putative photosynthetic complex assembly protein